MRNCLFIIVILSFCSCTKKKNESLLSFSSRYYREPTEVEFLNFNSIDSKISQTRSEDTLQIVVDFISSGCMNFDGDIFFRRDSLYLLYWNVNEEICTELSFYRMKYKILDTTQTKYKIGLINPDYYIPPPPIPR
jgi:hypothetical protein